MIHFEKISEVLFELYVSTVILGEVPHWDRYHICCASNFWQ